MGSRYKRLLRDTLFLRLRLGFRFVVWMLLAFNLLLFFSDGVLGLRQLDLKR